MHRRTTENIAKRVDVLVNKLDARYRGRTDISRPTAEILVGLGHSLLKTSLGPPDVLGRDRGRTRQRCAASRFATYRDFWTSGLRSQVATLIELKRGSVRLKDQLVLPVLEETLRQSGDKA